MDVLENKKRWTIRLSRAALLAALPGLYYLANLIRMLEISSAVYNAAFAVIGVLGLLCAVFDREDHLSAYWVFFLIYEFSLGVNWLIIGNASLSGLGSNALLFGVAALMLTRRWRLSLGAFVFYLSAALLIVRMVGGFRRILISSTNYVSVVLLLAVAFYYIALQNERGRIRLVDLLPAFVCFGSSVWARGRGGILSSTLLLILLLLAYMNQLTSKSGKRTVVAIIFALFIAAVLYVKNYSLIDAFLSLGKWQDRGIDNSARLYIWGSYLSKAVKSFRYLLLGVPLNKIPVVVTFGGNTHNSFLQLHAIGGLPICLVVLVLAVRALIWYLREKQYVAAAMFLALVVRASSDKFVFGQYGMPLMLYFLLLPTVERWKKRDEDESASGADEREAEL